jgi:hypothetical protein
VFNLVFPELDHEQANECRIPKKKKDSDAAEEED